MMIIVNRIGDSITGSCNGVPFGVSFSEEKYQLMKSFETNAQLAETMEELKDIVEQFLPLTQESYKELVETACPFLYVNKLTNKFYLRISPEVISNFPLPKAFVDRILKSVEKKIDVMPLVKCFIRLLRNPKFTDFKAQALANYINKTYTDPKLLEKLKSQGIDPVAAAEMATSYQTPITLEGLLVTYKVSTEITNKFVLDEETEEVKQKSMYAINVDPFTGLKTYDIPQYVEDRYFQPAVMGTGGDAFYCGDKPGHIIQVGKVHFLESEDMIDPTENITGVKGLHCGNLDYVRSYQVEGTVTHNIFVDPMDIRGFSHNGDGAIRTRRYFVYSSFAGVNRSIYHSSKYAEMTDAEYRNMLKEYIEEGHRLAEEKLNKTLANKKALI